MVPLHRDCVVDIVRSSPCQIAIAIVLFHGARQQTLGAQPRQKRARLSSSQQQQQPVVSAVDPLNSILSDNVIGEAMDGASLYNASAPAESNNVPNNNATTATKPSPVTKPTATKQYPGVAPGARPLVLVVEDTDVSASLLCMHLRKLNCTSHRAEDGKSYQHYRIMIYQSHITASS